MSLEDYEWEDGEWGVCPGCGNRHCLVDGFCRQCAAENKEADAIDAAYEAGREFTDEDFKAMAMEGVRE